MTTRAGLVGLVTGIIVSAALIYPFYVIWPGFCLHNRPVPGWPVFFLIVLAVISVGLGGGLASAWGPARHIGAGALAGGLAALVLFFSLGAATVGLIGLAETGAVNGSPTPETAARIIVLTYAVFWGLLWGGILLGAAGALFTPFLKFAPPAECFGGPDPQMALNTTITALPAAAFALVLAALFSSRLLEATGATVKGLLDWPTATGLSLYLLAQLALTWVTAYEARQATHRCGIDEVKMAAYVGIGVPLALALVWGRFSHFLPAGPLIGGGALLSLGLLARMVFVLCRLILPLRAAMLPPADGWEAALFGTIAGSRWQSLVLLCLGCAIMIVAPIYVTVGAVAVNLALAGPAAAIVADGSPEEWVQRWYGAQALAGWGSIFMVWLMLTVLYLFYLRLGKVFHRTR